MKIVMLCLFMLASCLIGMNANAGDVIQYTNGDQVEAPKGYKAVFVPAGTANTLIAVKLITLERPDPVDEVQVTTDPNGGCTPPGQLSFGGKPCPN